MRRTAAGAGGGGARDATWHATWAEGHKAVQKHTDEGGNPHCLWRALPGSSQKRNRARWQCRAHEDCPVVLSLGLALGGGFCLSTNGAEHGREPDGGPYR